MDRVGFSWRRLHYVALNTSREAMRQRLCQFLILLSLLAVLGAQAFRDFHFGSPELKFIADLGGGALACFGAVLTVVATAQLFFSEIERRTVLTLLAKPVWRTEFVLGKFAGVALVTGGFCVLLTGLLASVLWFRESALLRELPETFPAGRLISYSHLAVAGLLQWLRLLVLGALTLLVSSYARTQLFAVATGFLVLIACHMQPLARAAGTCAGATVSGVLTGMTARLLPNFQVFSLCDGISGNESLPWNQIAQVTLYGVAYTAAACGLAVICFRRREV